MDWRDAALATKGADKPCEACGNNRWAYAPDNVCLPTIDPKTGALRVIGDVGGCIVCVPRMCSNCGLLRLHVADFVRPSDN